MERKKFIQTLGAATAGTLLMNNLRSLAQTAGGWPDAEQPAPALFIGHGAPLYALGNNPYVDAWRKVGARYPHPRAIVSISAHWLTPGSTRVTAVEQPKTIYDFGRMDDRLYAINYPAPGDPALARYIADELTKVPVHEDHEWGFDHGTWCVLHHMYPEADIPVIQLSIDYARGAEYHYELGRQLRFLRRKGVVVMASGNIVHNLRRLTFPESNAFDWAIEFDAQSKALIDAGDHKALISWESLGSAARLSIPTPDHYFPLIYALGLQAEGDDVHYPIDGIAYGSTSMRSVVFSGAKAQALR